MSLQVFDYIIHFVDERLLTIFQLQRNIFAVQCILYLKEEF